MYGNGNGEGAFRAAFALAFSSLCLAAICATKFGSFVGIGRCPGFGTDALAGADAGRLALGASGGCDLDAATVALAFAMTSANVDDSSTSFPDGAEDVGLCGRWAAD